MSARKTPTRLGLEALDARVVPAAAGTLDPAFGTSGVAFLTGAPIADVAVQPDGKVVAVGSSGGDFVVARFNADGTPDNGFGAGGRRTFSVGTTDAARGIAVQTDGKIVVVGSADGDVAVARLNTDGSDDLTFNGSGRRVINLGGADSGNAVALQTDGKVVIGGVGGADPDFAAVRLDTLGGLDATFNGSGIRLVGFGGTDAANAVAVQADGSVVLAGAAGADIGVARLTSAGVPDAGFGAGGQRILDAGGATDSANGVALQTDGKIVLGGTDGAQLVAYRLLAADGSPDPSFGSGGRVGVNPTPTGNAANAVAVQPDGKVVLAGGTGTPDVTAVRLNADGSLDPAFGSGGIATFNLLGGAEAGNAVALTTGGRVVVGGTSGGGGVLLGILGQASGGNTLAVSGPGGGQVGLFTANAATGQFSATATVGPVSGIGFASVRSATGDVNGDGTPDTVLVTGPGAPLRVAVVSGADNSTLLVAPFDPFGGDFGGGGFVAVGDLDNDGRAEFVVTPDQGGGPRVSVFSLVGGDAVAVRANFLGIDDPNFRGGARAAVGDVNGDGTPDVIVAAGFGGGPRTAIFTGQSVLAGTPTRLVGDFFAFPGSDAVNLRNGSFVASGDVDGDGFDDLIFGGGPGGAPRVFILDGQQVSAGNVAGAQANPIANFFVAGNTDDRGGVRVAAKDADGDAKADVVVGSGEGSPARVRVYLGANFTTAAEPTTFQDLSVFGGGPLATGVFVG